jgi:hypothetical protein
MVSSPCQSFSQDLGTGLFIEPSDHTADKVTYITYVYDRLNRHEKTNHALFAVPSHAPMRPS